MVEKTKVPVISIRKYEDLSRFYPPIPVRAFASKYNQLDSLSNKKENLAKYSFVELIEAVPKVVCPFCVYAIPV